MSGTDASIRHGSDQDKANWLNLYVPRSRVRRPNPLHAGEFLKISPWELVVKVKTEMSEK